MSKNDDTTLSTDNKILVPVSVVPVLPRNGYDKARRFVSDFVPTVVPTTSTASRRARVNDDTFTADDGTASQNLRITTNMTPSGGECIVSTDQSSFYSMPYSKGLAQELSLQHAFRIPLELPPGHRLSRDESRSAGVQGDVLEDQLSRLLYLERTSARFGAVPNENLSAVDGFLAILHPDLEPIVNSCRAVLEPLELPVADSDWLRLADHADDILCGHSTKMSGFFCGGKSSSCMFSARKAVDRWCLLARLRGEDGSSDEEAAKTLFGESALKSFVNPETERKREAHDKAMDEFRRAKQQQQQQKQQGDSLQDASEDEDDILGVAKKKNKSKSKNSEEEDEHDGDGDEDGDEDDGEQNSGNVSSDGSDDDESAGAASVKSKLPERPRRLNLHLGHNVEWKMAYHFYVTSNKCPNSSHFIPFADLEREVMGHIEQIKQKLKAASASAAASSSSSSFSSTAETTLSSAFALTAARRLTACKRVLLRAAKELDGVAAELIRRRLVVGAELARYASNDKFYKNEWNARRARALWAWYSAQEVGMQPTVIFALAHQLKQDIRRVFEPFGDDDTTSLTAMQFYKESDVLDKNSQMWPSLSRLWMLPVSFLLAETDDQARDALTGGGGDEEGAVMEKLQQGPCFQDAERIFLLVKQSRNARKSLSMEELRLVCGYKTSKNS